MNKRPFRFTVPCVAEIEHHIGSATAWITAHDSTDFEIECLTNEYGGERSGETVSPGLWTEIQEEVVQYFVAAAEAAADSLEDR